MFGGEEDMQVEDDNFLRSNLTVDKDNPLLDDSLEDKKSVIKQDSLFAEGHSLLIQATQVDDKIETEITNTKETYS